MVNAPGGSNCTALRAGRPSMGSPKGLDYDSSLLLLLEQFSQLRDVRAEQLHLYFVERHPTALVLGLEQGFDRRDVSECVACRRGWRGLARGSRRSSWRRCGFSWR